MSIGVNLLGDYDRAVMAHGEATARANLIAALAAAPESVWLDCAQRAVLRGRTELALALLEAAHRQYLQSPEIAFALAGLLRGKRDADAEALLQNVLQAKPDHAAAALLLARWLGDSGRTYAAAQVLRSAFIDHHQSLDLLIRAMELLDTCERKADAAALAEAAIAAGCDDARIHAYAATYLIQLGEFARARERYLYAWAHSAQAAEWNVPFGLSSAQRYRDAAHEDFALFRECLARSDLSDAARTTLLFGMGKAHDDIGDAAQAAQYFRQANALAHERTTWSRKAWRRGIDARTQARALPARTRVDSGFVPIFVVGVPRSGTTLTAELLARHPQVCNRGEMSVLWKLAQRLPLSGVPDAALLDALAAEYEAQIRQDDAGNARWFIDKQPLNLLHVDLALALWPQAKIVVCERSARDTALSLWLQYFREETYGFAYDFADIAAVQQGCAKLAAHWQKRHPESIRTLRYEALTADAEVTIAQLADWIGLPRAEDAAARSSSAINTASLWQARQPVYTRSVGRWKTYAPFVPELMQFADA